jgi:hypothetical protein
MCAAVTRIGRRVRRAALALVAVAVALVAAEAGARVHEGTTTFPTDGRGFATRPGTRGTNSRGFFEREDVPTGAIAVLGDSMTHGTTTPEEAWPRLAEGLLGRAITNYSHYGYDAAQSAATLRHHVWRDEPAMVVFAAYGNDLVPTRMITVGEPPTLAWLGPRTALGRAAAGVWHRRGYREEEEPAAFSAALADMVAQTKERGVPFLVYAMAAHTLDGLDRMRTIEASCAGVPYASAAPYLRARPGDYFPADRDDREHPDPAGHRVVAEGFVDVLGRWERGEPLPRVDDAW